MTRKPALGDDVLGEIQSPEAIMRKHFYRKSGEAAAPEPQLLPMDEVEEQEDTRFRRVNISLLPEDSELLNEMIRTLRKRKHRRVSKSQIIRYALKTADLEKMRQSYWRRIDAQLLRKSCVVITCHLRTCCHVGAQKRDLKRILCS
jgi:hypothetical protein